MKKWAALILGASLGAGFLCGTTWDATFESSPAGTSLVSDLDTVIQLFKQEVRRRGSVETIYGNGTNDNGLLRLGGGRCYIQNAAPTDIVGPGAYVSSSSTFSATPLGTNEPGGTIDIGTGRCWIDLDGLDGVAGTGDDRQLNIWVDTVGWVASAPTAGSATAPNLIYNGSFEITSGTGSAASVSVPDGWTDIGVGAPTFSYTDPTAVSEGEGLAFNVTGVGAGDTGVQQTLAGLKASTRYLIRARANATTAGDVCNLNVTGGTVSPVNDATAATGAFETLEAAVTTTAVPGSLVVQLRTTNATDVCRWDHVTAFETNAQVSQPGIQVASVLTQTSTALTNTFVGAPNPLMTRAVTPPSPGYIVMAHADVTVIAGSQTAQVAVRLQENGATVAMSMCGTTQNAAGTQTCTLPLHHVNTSPTSGTTLSYTVDARESSGGLGTWNPLTGGDQTTSRLTVELIPTR